VESYPTKKKSTYKISCSTGIEQQEVTLHSPERHHQRIQLPAIYAPQIFTGLFLTLWVYKCFVMIFFQNKIIYMPSMPPLARKEKIQDYDKECRPVVWREERIRSGTGWKLQWWLALCQKRETMLKKRGEKRG